MKRKFYNNPNFYGTESYYRHITKLIYTNGIQHMAETLQCYWLLDMIHSYIPLLTKKFIKDNYLFTIELLRKDPEQDGGPANFYIYGDEDDDGNRKLLIHQGIVLTDIKEDVQLPMTWDGENFITCLWSEY